ncbi:GNAT family N-acetyltransferase [Macrococcus sp. DPC7161]|uniref:GNAT family N-acetyltransferase n=1 Tax=Macrococcus sp. DPC7161 TaxID=2507060 RepID=UPI00100B8D25|nr:GNAT family N-acetyltransferase [Macrococcus sp. DPC7161]RXK19177.1 GNAT family N-acetyltransferase [Macrococcus sp. DPC7161]
MIRKLKEDDILKLTKLFKTLGYPIELTTDKHRFINLLNHPDYHMLVIEKEDRIIGFCGMCKMLFFEKNGCYMRILAFVIDEDYQNQGYGKLLLEESEKLAKDLTCDIITLNSGNRKERNNAHKFYINNGYRIKASGFVKSL